MTSENNTNMNTTPNTNQKTIVTSIENRVQFLNLLKNNPGIIIIKFGAEWCGPCKTIQDTVYDNFKQMPENVICADINVTHNFDVYTFLKSKRMINGIPAIFAYYSDNTSFVPSDSIVGADIPKINEFFNNCTEYAKSH